MKNKRINIRPTTSVYATYKNIKYRPWTAVAEFVDNSTQSYYSNKSKLKTLPTWDGLDVEILYDRNSSRGDQLTITDNAFGMNFEDFKRAIILDSPPKRATRSEFGMGLKTAACWFGTKWSVESTELGSSIKYKAEVDVELLRKYKNEEIIVEEKACDPTEHGTVITIWELNRKLAPRQIGKTKEQIAGMYRVDLRRGDISIFYNGEALEYTDPPVLVEELPDGTKKKWKEKIKFNIPHEGKEYRVKGFIALREEGSTSSAGFTLMRRGRVIVGGYDDTYRPEEKKEKSNSFVYQRLFGEIELNNWPVTQTKDAFDWYSGLEDKLIDELKEICRDYINKAKTYRKPKKIEVKTSLDEVVNKFEKAGVIDSPRTTSVKRKVAKEIETSRDVDLSATQNSDEGIRIEGSNSRSISYKIGGRRCVVNFVLKTDNPSANWINIKQSQASEGEYIIEWNIKHPFFKPYIDDPAFLAFMETFTFAFVLSEIEAYKTCVDGKISPSTIRMKMNDYLKSIIKEQ